MAWKQVVQPRLGTTDYAGWCLRFAQSVFGAPAMHRSAWIAWNNALGRHHDRNFPTDVAVIVWFEHWGDYGFWDNWGHVAVWIPGRGYLSSPVTWNGKGSQWFSNIEDLERALPGKYVGWSEGINGLRVIERTNAPAPAPKPKPKPKWEDTMKAFSGGSSRKKNQTIKGGKPEYVTFLDSYGDSKWGNRTIARGPGDVVGLNVTARFKGEPGTRVNLELVRETGSNKGRVRIGEARVTLDTYGAGTEQIGFSGHLRSGQLVRLLAHVQNGKTVEVEQFYWSGMARPS